MLRTHLTAARRLAARAALAPRCTARVMAPSGVPSSFMPPVHPLARHAGALRHCSGRAENKSAKEGAEAGAEGASSSKEEAAPMALHERFLADLGALFDKLKTAAGSATEAASSVASSAASSASSAASSARSASSGEAGGAAGAAAGGEEGQQEAGSGAVMVREPSFWERHFQQESPFFERLRGVMGGAGDAAGRVGDFFGETEQAEAMGLLREQMPEFRQEAFLEHISEDLGPEVISAYLKGDLDVLRANCRDQAYAILSSSVHERVTRQIRMDPRILHMSEPELESVRIINGQPTPIVSFETHQLYCIRNSLTGKVEEGDEDDIRAFYYLWALQLNEESDAKEKWQVTELAIRGVLQTY